jgi:hypothetical protein
MKMLKLLTILLIPTILIAMEDQPYERVPIVVQTVQTSMSSDSPRLERDTEQQLRNLSSMDNKDTALDIELSEQEVSIQYPNNTSNKITQTKITASDSPKSNSCKDYCNMAFVGSNTASFLSGLFIMNSLYLIYHAYYS